MSISACNEDLLAQGLSYPRTCARCGLGPCSKAPSGSRPQPPEKGVVVSNLEQSIKLLQRNEVNQSQYVEGWNDALSMVLHKLNEKNRQFTGGGK